MSKLKHEIKEEKLIIEVPEDATSEEIRKYEEDVFKKVMEASGLPVNFVMIDSGQQIV